MAKYLNNVKAAVELISFLLVIAKLKYEISGCFMLVNNLLAKESTAGETRMRLK